MIEIIIFIICCLLLIFIFFRRWFFLEKWQLFGKMIMKTGHKTPQKLTKEDHEITLKDMIPAKETVDPRLSVKGDAFFKKAELAIKRNQIKEAEKLLIRSISMDPSHKEAYAKLGMIYLNQGLNAKAELIFRKLTIAEPSDPAYFSNLGLALFNQEKFQEAKGFYEKAIEIDDKRPGRFFGLARISYAINEFDSAIFNIQKALALDPDNLDYGLTLASWYIEKGMRNDAKIILEEIIKFWPDNKDAIEMFEQMNNSSLE